MNTADGERVAGVAADLLGSLVDEMDASVQRRTE
jgi:hypothetical protein